VNLNSIAVRKVLPLLALRPGEGFTLTALCAFSGLDTKSVARVLSAFREEGLIADGRYGPKTYSVNPDFSMYPEVKVIALRLLDVPGLIRASRPGSDPVVVVFGSLLRPTFGRDSDIDLLVVTEDRQTARRGVDALSNRIGKPINLVLLDRATFAEKLRDGDPFIRGILEGPHAVLGGRIELYETYS
jgi:predicted nucleotidyltransferase